MGPMAGEDAPGEHPGALGALRRIADGISTAMNVAGTFFILALAILVNADVIGRELFLSPISGVPEIVSISIVAIVFLQVPQAFRMGRFTRTENLIDAITARSPRLRSLIELVYLSAAAILISLLFQASYPLFARAWTRGTYRGTVGDFTTPDWPVNAVILLGCAALIMQFAVAILFTLADLFSGSKPAPGSRR